MLPDSLYALGKLSNAVYVLATGPGNVRSRLGDAYEYISSVASSDLPEDLQQDLQWIKASVSKYEPNDAEIRMGLRRLDATLGRIKNKTGVRIAQRIVELESKLRDRLH